MAPTLEAYSPVSLRTKNLLTVPQPHGTKISECCSWVATPWLGQEEGLLMED